ncbi:hypothetical protein AAZV13_07G140600 [Glycine max]|uniref:Exocyst complex component Sec10-like alpha-helical bundle domain-containing protein n=2 Tax=Glycine subgen. Soja TaxID=1462606 RepID=A0A0R0JAA2_SOYBN
MSPFEMQDILLPSGTNGVKDLHISVSHSSSLALFASLGKKLSVLSLDSGNLVVNYDLQFNRGTSAMQHYVATRPMFIDVEIMNADTKLVLGDLAGQASPSNVARGLSSLYKEITDTVHKEAATITAVFPSPSEVMSILVQRVLEQ